MPTCLICGRTTDRGRSRCPEHSRRKAIGPRLTTTQQGYGWDHQQDRDRKLKQLIPGTPCPICKQGMYPTQGLDLHHLMPKARGGADHDTNRALAHARCNRSVQDKVGGAPLVPRTRGLLRAPQERRRVSPAKKGKS